MSIQKNNLIFIGFQATGKSTIAKALSKKLYWPVYDIDELIENVFSIELNAFIIRYGEKYFRSIESTVFKFFALKKFKKIISTGGGFILKYENRILARKTSIIILLIANQSDILRRISHSKRKRFRFFKNLMLKQEIKNLLAKRNFYYNSINDYKYNTSKRSVNWIIKDVICILNKYKNASKFI